MSKLILAFILAAASLMLIGCNTMKGAGQDLQAGGKKLERTAANQTTSDSPSDPPAPVVKTV